MGDQVYTDGLEAQLKRVEISNNPVDIATLVYIRG